MPSFGENLPDPAITAAMVRKGIALHQRGDLVGAERHYRSALAAAPRHPEALHFLGLCLAGRGELDTAVALLETAIEADPTAKHYHVNLGDMLRQLGRSGAAEESYRRALALDADDTQALCRLGELLTARDDFPRALELLQKALDLHPTDPEIRCTKAATLVRAGRTEEALSLLEPVLKAAPELAIAHHTRATALADLGHIEDSETEARAAVSLNPKLAASHWHIGLCRYDAGDLDGAIDAFRTTVRAAPQLALAQAGLGIVLLENGAVDEGKAALQSAADRHPKLAALLDGIDYLYEVKQRDTASQPRTFSFKAKQLKHALDAADRSGLILELGVFSGRSLTLIADHVGPGCAVHGFDSFEGLPENWVEGVGKGSYDAGGQLPDVPKNVTLHPGWFEDSLPRFVEAESADVSFANIDCDIYSSTRTFFECFDSRIKPGTVLVFDEYFAYPGWREHEFRAFQEFIAGRKLSYDYLALSPFTRQATVRCKKA